MEPIATGNLKLSLHKTKGSSNARLWLEGAKLAKAGFAQHDRLSFVLETVDGIDTVTVVKSPTGKDGICSCRKPRKAGGPALPIIDRGMPQWTALVGTHKLSVEYYAGMVVATPVRK